MSKYAMYYVGLEMNGTITLGVSIGGRNAVIDIDASSLYAGTDIVSKLFDEFSAKHSIELLEMAILQPIAHQLTANLQGEIIKKLKETCELVPVK